jgi:hypothetical protein
MPGPVDYKPVRVLTRSEIPNPPVPGTEYRVADEHLTVLALSNGTTEEYGTPGATDYNALGNKPSINGVELSGNLTGAQLSLASQVVYEHTQSTPANTWNIQHNLGKKYVDIRILDSTDEEIVGEEDWAASTDNLLVVHFSEPVSGKAYAK